MTVKLILLENVEGVGKIGEEVSVAAGYARNYLVPRGLGLVIETRHKKRSRKQQNSGVLRQLEGKKRQLQNTYEQEVAQAQQLAAEINSQSLTVPVQAQEDGKLFGSVGPQQIVAALKELGIEVDRRKVALPEPIRELGMTTVEIHLHPEVTAGVKLWVVKMDG